jgi:uncharacterized membrane protein
MAQVPHYGFDIEREAEMTRYRISGVGLGFVMMSLIIILAIILGWLFSAIVGNWFPLIASPFCGCALIWFRNSARKAPVIISVTRTGLAIEKTGETTNFDRTHIGNISLQNDTQKRVLQTTNVDESGRVIFAGSGIAGVASVGFAAATLELNRAANQMGRAAGQAAAEEAAARGWSVRMRYGSQHVPLIKHMKQGTAEAFYMDLCGSLAA